MIKLAIASVLVVGMVSPGVAAAQAENQYQINSFNSRIEILQDTRIRVTEQIEANFLVPKHGIFRVIPNKYSQAGIDSQVKVESVSDASGNKYEYTTSTIDNDVEVKIGSAGSTLVGAKTYILTYTASHMVRRFSDHDELYWNVVGSKWDTEVLHARAEVISPWAKISKTSCFSGPAGSTDGSCDKGGIFEAADLRPGEDMTIVVGLDKNNQLKWPGWWEENWKKILGYGGALLPAIIMAIVWYRRGRDWRYKNNPNIYVKPDGGEIEPVPMRPLEYLPLAYTPIKGMTPAEAGTIIDQKVDVADVTAEIVELARLRYIELKKADKGDYWIIDKHKNPDGLREYQRTLLTGLTKREFAVKGQMDATAVKKMSGKFTTELNDFKNQLYDYLDKNQIFAGRPDKTRVGWLSLWGITAVISVWAGWRWGYGWVLAGSSVVAGIFAYQLPRRTAWGHNLYRQLAGLRYYIDKGKWRYEIAEKRLFLEEILPLAVALGVVDKLATDMKGLGVEAPQYMGNMPITYMGGFNRAVGSSLAASAKAAGGWGNSGGHWSGGSGFGGGGFSGGGGGGGGGGSW